jgi:flagellar protein FlaJ
MEIKKIHIWMIAVALAVLIIDFYLLLGTPVFIPMIAVAIVLGAIPFGFDFFAKQQRNKELEEKFPEFVRNLVGAIKSGMPAPKAILAVSTTDYGSLTPHVKKLANQIEWAIPLHKALLTFANETKNAVIKRAIFTVIQAEVSGGNIEDVLQSVTESVIEIKKIKERRKALINSQVIQNYIIFAVFLIVMVVIQNMLVPYVANIEQKTMPGLESGGIELMQTGMTGMTKIVTIDTTSIEVFLRTLGEWLVSLHGIFLMIAIIQGFFAGLVIGKLSEGDLSSGIKHSIILMLVSFLLITFAQGLI